jgi:hypothetical protein
MTLRAVLAGRHGHFEPPMRPRIPRGSGIQGFAARGER